MSSDTGYYSIIDYAVDGPQTQRELVAAFAELQERWVRFYPGYGSARIFASLDGTRVYNVVHWASEADYLHFETTSDTAGRVAAIEAAVASVSGWAEPRMTGPPRFTIACEGRARATADRPCRFGLRTGDQQRGRNMRVEVWADRAHPSARHSRGRGAEPRSRPPGEHVRRPPGPAPRS